MTDLTMTIAGETFPIKPMTDGQVESMFRIQRSLAAAGGENTAFYARQIGRMGDLIDNILAKEADIDRLDRLYLSGKASTVEVLKMLFVAYQASTDEDTEAVVAIVAKKKPAVAITAKKAPAKKAVRARAK